LYTFFSPGLVDFFLTPLWCSTNVVAVVVAAVCDKKDIWPVKIPDPPFPNCQLQLEQIQKIIL